MAAFTEAEKRARNRVVLNVDLTADLTGYRAARRVTPAHLKLLHNYASPLLAGPPPSDALLEIVMHLFSEEEAEVAQHLPPLWPRTAAGVAAKLRRPVAEVAPILDHLAYKKHVLMAFGTPRRYGIMPILPGTFEMVLMTTNAADRNAWHRRFAELFEHLWNTGFLADYAKQSKAFIRYLPVASVGQNIAAAWPSDKLDEVLEPHEDFAVGHCQCRLAMQLTGNGCKSELETCAGYGKVAGNFVALGLMRPASKQEILDIKHQAEKAGQVTFIGNAMGGAFGNVSCSCCGCCCHALRTISELNAPGTISRPHFRPRLKEPCKVTCKKCVQMCPVDAWTAPGDALVFDAARCIGCGLCAASCNFGNLEMTPVDDADRPGHGWLDLLLKMAPGYAALSAQVWSKRYLGSGPGSVWTRWLR
jgi:Pyruvate/2-oxoacid:ferredoxin oxidoreductase delta subunit